MNNKIQLWKGNIMMTLVDEKEVPGILKSFEERGYYYGYNESAGYIHYEEKKPYYAMTPEERKQIKKKVTCKYCAHKQFYKNTDMCRYCYNYNPEWD